MWRSFQNLKDVGIVQVKVIRAEGLMAADVITGKTSTSKRDNGGHYLEISCSHFFIWNQSHRTLLEIGDAFSSCHLFVTKKKTKTNPSFTGV